MANGSRLWTGTYLADLTMHLPVYRYKFSATQTAAKDLSVKFSPVRLNMLQSWLDSISCVVFSEMQETRARVVCVLGYGSTIKLIALQVCHIYM